MVIVMIFTHHPTRHGGIGQDDE